MAEATDLNAYRIGKAGERGLAPWKERFGEAYPTTAHLSDLSDNTLLFLAQPGDENVMAFYELIMGILDLGNASGSDRLEPPRQLEVMDIHLYLTDRVRFEVMRRLGWLASYPGESCSLVELVLTFHDRQYEAFENPPLLSADHPDHEKFQSLIDREKGVFVRKLLTNALQTFQEKLE
ncbi:MAG: hypothetical protein GY866_02675 [Proteobacteria bacterium]|nr:hypothetical protein [Pseudomonadota bacterium]